MAKIIDILSWTPQQHEFFVVDTMVDTVIIPNGGDKPIQSLNNAGAAIAWFQAGDNISVLSGSLLVPEVFKLSANAALGEAANPFMTLKWFDGVTLAVLPQFGSNGTMLFPVANQEIGIDVFIPAPTTTASFTLQASLGQVKISMINVPVVYNTKTFGVNLFLKIQHNFTLMIAP